VDAGGALEAREARGDEGRRGGSGSGAKPKALMERICGNPRFAKVAARSMATSSDGGYRPTGIVLIAKPDS
jgi:hypothetical protein